MVRAKRKLDWQDRLGGSARAEAGKVHFVGIAGIGMSGLALYLKDRGWTVSGSDLDGETARERLRHAGIPTQAGHDEAHLPKEVDLVVKTAAIGDGNPELEEAERRGLPVASYAQALGALTAERATVAVAGTHGKTTTAAMLAAILDRAGLEPGAVIGGAVPQIGGNVLYGSGEPFVVEACEYRESFLELKPKHAILANVDADHLDYYKTMDRLRAAFRRFAKGVDVGGLIVTSAELAKDLDIRGATRGRVVTIGASKHDVRVREEGGGFCLVHPDGRRSGLLPAPLPGKHNLMNAAMAAVMAHKAYGVKYSVVREALETFAGVDRRFEVLVERPDVVLVDDYAHHPTEIEATLLAARERYPDRKLIAVFQPHLADRTRRHFSGFLNALAISDEALILRDYQVAGRDETKIEAAGPDVPTVGARRVQEMLGMLSHPSQYFDDFGAAADRLITRRRGAEAWVVMGAGDIHELSRELHARIR